MENENKENTEPDREPKVRVEEVNLNGSDEESDKGEWAVVYEDSDSSISSEKNDIAQKVSFSLLSLLSFLLKNLQLILCFISFFRMLKIILKQPQNHSQFRQY